MRLSWSELISRLNASYWFVPLVVTATGAGLAIVMIALASPAGMSARDAVRLLHPNSAEGARALLTAIVGAVITALSVTVSVTIVAVTVAAQHFGPRVLNKLVRDTSAQVALGTLMATFVYSVLVLGSIDGSAAAGDTPDVAVAGAVLMVLFSIGALIFYVQHFAASLKIGDLASQIAQDFTESVGRSSRNSGHDPADAFRNAPEAPPGAAEIPAEESGYMQRVDYDAIVRSAARRDAVVWIRREPGAFVIAGSALALVHPPAACDDDFARTVRRACVFGPDRTLWQDPESAAKQLVEVALRALSPGVNEPFTAITCIDRLAEGLAAALSAPEPRASWSDQTGAVRLCVQPQRFETLLRAAFDPIRIFAGRNPAIYVRLLDTLAELGTLATRQQDLVNLRHHVDLVWAAGQRELTSAEDLAFVEARLHRAVEQFTRGPSSSRR